MSPRAIPPTPEGAPVSSEAKAEAQLQRWVSAELALVDLQAPNVTELRGRAPKEGYERIEAFIDADRLYKVWEREYSGAGQGQRTRRSEFQEAVRERLSIFERLAARNPDLQISERTGQDPTCAYRILTAHVYHLLRRAEEPTAPTIFKLEPIAPTDLSGLSVRDPQAADKAATTTPAPVDLELRKLETQFFDDLVLYVEGRMDTFTAQADLASRVAAARIAPPTPALAEMLDELLPPTHPFVSQLEMAHDIVHRCRMLASDLLQSALESVALARDITALYTMPLNGMGSVDEPFVELELEGLLSAERIAALKQVKDAFDSAHPLTHKLAEGPLRTPLVVNEFGDLSAAVNELLLAGWSAEKLEGPIRHVLSAGPHGIAHLQSLARLATLGIDVKPYFAASSAAQGVIADAAAGKFNLRAPTSRPIAEHVTSEIEARLDVLRRAPAAVQGAIAEAMSAVPDGTVEGAGEIRSGLVVFARHLAPGEIEQGELKRVANRLLAYMSAGCKVR